MKEKKSDVDRKNIKFAKRIHVAGTANLNIQISKVMKLLWIDLNCSFSHSSLALPALHAQVMDNSQVEWAVVHSTNGEPTGIAVNAIYNHRPDVIAATAWLFTHEQLMHIIKRIKALLPHATVILGGPEFLGENETFLRQNPEVNAVLRGEGEESFAEWIKIWDETEHWNTIPGLCHIANGRYHDGGIARVLHFDKLLPPEASSLFCWDKPFVQIETTRGCFNTCAFCVSGAAEPIRQIPIEAIRERLQNIRKHGIRDVRVLDRTFNHHPQQALTMLQLFAEFHPYLRFHLEIHPALLPPNVREMLATLPTGLLHLEAGMQSLRQEVLDRSQRKGTLAQGLDGLQYLCSLPNLITHADLIAGLPSYTLAQIYQDIQTLAICHTGEIQLESLKLLPGTAMRSNAAKLGIRYSPLPPYEVLETDAISNEQLQEARRLSRLLDAYYNTETWQMPIRQLIIHEEDFLHRFLHYLTTHNHIEQPMSLERRGELLYLFCCEYYPNYTAHATIAWIEAGMSLKKRPAEHILTGHLQPPNEWTVIYGEYTDQLRLCLLPTGPGGEGYWFGYSNADRRKPPVFKAEKRKTT